MKALRGQVVRDSAAPVEPKRPLVEVKEARRLLVYAGRALNALVAAT